MSRINRMGLAVFLTLITLSLQEPVEDTWSAVGVGVTVLLVLVGGILLTWPKEGEP